MPVGSPGQEDARDLRWDGDDIDVESGASRLRIGVLASIAHRTPPRGYGPWEQVASTLAEGLVALGHDVTLFATADSITTARLHAEAPRGYEEDPGVDAKVYEGLHNAAAFERADEFDVAEQPVRLHAADLQPAGVDAGGDHHPRLLVGADPAGLPRLRRHRALRRDQRRGPAPGPDLRRDDPPRHRPLPLHLPRSARATTCCSSAASIPTRAPTGRSRSLAGPGCRWSSPGIVQDEDYFRDSVQPHLGAAGVSYVGPVGPAERDALLGGALALLHLIGFAEPFGLSVVESLATGTPVIAYPLGSMPEIIRPGRTGFLVDDVAGAVEAVGEVAALSRRHCRDDVEERFTAARMVADYAELFARIAVRRPVGGQPLEEQRQRRRRRTGRTRRSPRRAAATGRRAAARRRSRRRWGRSRRARRSSGTRSGSRSAPMTRLGSSRSSSSAPMEYSRIGPTPWVRTSQPASVSTGEPQFPIWSSSHGRVGVCSVRASPHQTPSGEVAMAVVLPVPAGEGEVPAVDPTREQGHSLVLGGGPGELGHPETPEVVGLDELRGDRRAVERRVGRPVDALVLDAHEAGVLDAARLRRALRPQHPLGERGRRRELDLVAARGDAPGQLGGTRGGRAGEPLVGQAPRGPRRARRRRKRRCSRPMTKAADSRSMSCPASAAANTSRSYDVGSVRPASMCGPGSSMLELPDRTQNPGAELHRGQMPLADRAQAQDEPAAPGRRGPTGRGARRRRG